MGLESHTIVRKVRGGRDGGRFVILSEQGETTRFVFMPLGPEMTMQATCDALVARGISGEDATKLVAEAVDDFDGRQERLARAVPDTQSDTQSPGSHRTLQTMADENTQ